MAELLRAPTTTISLVKEKPKVVNKVFAEVQYQTYANLWQTVKQQPSSLLSLVAGGIAGGVEATATVSALVWHLCQPWDTDNGQYPTEFLKTRSQLRTEGPQQGVIRTFQNVVRNEGISALYTGCSTLVVVCGHFNRINTRWQWYRALLSKPVLDFWHSTQSSQRW